MEILLLLLFRLWFVDRLCRLSQTPIKQQKADKIFRGEEKGGGKYFYAFYLQLRKSQEREFQRREIQKKGVFFFLSRKNSEGRDLKEGTSFKGSRKERGKNFLNNPAEQTKTMFKKLQRQLERKEFVNALPPSKCTTVKENYLLVNCVS